MAKKKVVPNIDEDPDTGKGHQIIMSATKAFSTMERYNAQRTWALLAEFCVPSQNRNWFEDISKGIRRDKRVFDSTAINANRDLASAMHSTITNPTMKWSKFRWKDESLNEDKDARQWLDDASDAFHDRLNDSNFDSQIGTAYYMYSGVGTMLLFQDEDFNFTAWHLSEIAIMENDKQEVDRVYRRFYMTIQAAYDKWGDKIGEYHLDKLKVTPQEEIKVYHCIFPRKDSEVSMMNPIGLSVGYERPFASCYVIERGFILVEEDGFYEFPVYVARWQKLPGEVYGFGPGQVCIADIRSLSSIKEKNLEALALSVRPPILATKGNIFSGDLRPGKVTQVADASPNSFRELITQSRFDVVQQEVQSLQAAIKSAFYIDKLMLPPRTETGEMTAYEVSQRLEQMQQFMGPILSRLNNEFLKNMVTRSLKILLREGKLKPLPGSVTSKLKKGKSGNAIVDFDIMFVNSLARAQQMSELRNVQQFVQETANIAQIKPEAIDNLDVDAIIDYGAKIRDIPENFIVPEDQVKKIRQQRQQAQATQQGVATGAQAAGAVNDLAQAHAAVKGASNGGQGGQAQ